MISTIDPQPLGGLKVLDFTTLLPGPLATLLLAEAGANVLKVERPGSGEELRHGEPAWGSSSANFAMLNRGKKSLAIDLKDPQNRQILEPLLREADVLVEQFRPGVMERLALGYESVSAINPRLIYCSISGYGQTGPKANVAGHDINYIGDTGLLDLGMGDTKAPKVPPVLAADIAGGSYPAVMNILLALLQRNITGKGSHLDISMTDNMFSLMTWAVSQGIVGGEWPKPSGELLTGGSPRYQLYPTKDGRIAAIGCLEQKFWEAFCKAIDLPEALRDDSADPKASIAGVAKIIAEKTSDEWAKIFYDADCCASIVKTLKEAICDDHFHMRGVFDHTLENENGETLPATSVSVARQFRDDPGIFKGAPALGAHNDVVISRKTGPRS